MGTAFLPGLELAGQFYADVVRPLLDEQFPGLCYSAALLGPGSEVLGFDSARSTDHDWGPRLQTPAGAGDAGHGTGPDHVGAGPRAARQLPRLPGPLRAQRRAARRGPAPRPGRGARRVAARPARLRPAGRDHRARLAGHAHPAAGRAGRRRGVPRRAWVSSTRSGPAWPGIPGTSGATCWPASGSGSARKNPFPAGAPRPATTSARVVITARLARDLMRLCLLMDRSTRRTASGLAPRSPGAHPGRRWARRCGPR